VLDRVDHYLAQAGGQVPRLGVVRVAAEIGGGSPRDLVGRREARLDVEALPIYLRASNTLLGVIMATGFKNPKGVTYTTISMAANVYYILPMVIVFFFAQKNILKGVITSGLKG
jgi:hypothetical protein